MSASLLPNGEQTFLDDNGNPLASGTVTFYVPGTSTPKNTWGDSAQTQLNTNPVVLDAAGRAIIYGDGSYRMVLQDALGNTIYDQLTDSPISSASLSNTSGSGGTSLIGFNGGTLADYLKNNSSCVVPSIATLRSLDSTLFTKAFVLGYYAAGDGGGGEYFVDSADTSSLDNGGTIIVAADNARWKTTQRNYITSCTFGAKGDSTTDDTAALQRYINWCLSFSVPVGMSIVGMCRITSSLNIDIPVLPTIAEFRIFGLGSNAGFYVDTNITMFDSTIAMTTDPVSGPVTFEGIRAEAASTATTATFISGKFLRCKFLNCYYHKINFCSTTSYLQSFYWQNCTFRYWPGVLIGADHVFDCTFASCITEFGGGYVFFLPAGSYGLRLVDGVHEGSLGGLVAGGGFRALKISGYYGEGNAFPFMGADYGPQNPDIEISNTWVQSQAANVSNASFYEFVWGNTLNAISHNNTADNGRLHNLDSLPFTFGSGGTPILWSTGDRAAVALASKPLYLSNASGTFSPTFNIGGGTINYATYRRDGYRVSIEFNVTCPTSGSGSPVQLQGLPYAALNTVFGGETVYTGITGGVFLIGGTGAGATQTSVGFCSNQQATGINGLTASGKGLIGKLEYFI